MVEGAGQIPKTRLAIYRSSSIGDTVLATACINLLRNLSADAEIIWIGRQPALGLLQSAFPGMQCIEVQRTDGVNSHWDIAKQLAGVHFIVDLQTNLRSRLICGATSRINGVPAYTCSKQPLRRGSMVLRARLEGRRRKLPRHVVQPGRLQYELMADTLRTALLRHWPQQFAEAIRVATAKPHLPLPKEPSSALWHKELRIGRWLAVAPGAAHAAKQAPIETFIQSLAPLKQLAAPAGIVYLGNEQDRKVAVAIADALNWPGATLNLAGKISLWESALALAEVEALLSNDSALGHIAEAVGTPVGMLFGPTVEGFGFKPWMGTSQSFSINLGCRPCSKHGRNPCRYDDQLCFKSIPLEPITDFLNRRLDAFVQRSP